MGYRSDIYLEFKTKSAKKVMSDINERIKVGLNGKETEELYYLKKLFNKIKVSEDGTKVILTAEYVKWYDYFEDVKAVMSYIDELGEEMVREQNENGRTDDFIHFIRIGESYEDIEELRYGDDWASDLRIIRNVDINNEFNFDTLYDDEE